MWTHCSYCGFVFEREPGYFVGAIYINVIVTEALLLAIYLLSLLTSPATNSTVITLLYALAIVFPLVFYHHSRSLWLSIDYIIGSWRDEADSNAGTSDPEW
jgi:hypothetical protein